MDARLRWAGVHNNASLCQVIMSNSFIQHWHDAVPRQTSNNKTATINTNKHQQCHTTRLKYNYDIQKIKLQTITNKQVIMTWIILRNSPCQTKRITVHFLTLTISYRDLSATILAPVLNNVCNHTPPKKCSFSETASYINFSGLPHRLQGQKVKSQGHGAGTYCGGHLAAQLVCNGCVHK